MRHLIVCCDGTWNTPDQEKDGIPSPTNVVRLYNALAETTDQGVEQLKYYHPGVGTEGNWWDKLLGGGVGIGLSRNVMSAYKWLGAHYQPGDRIFLFGFSRGAYTVRSAAGMITSCGLLDLAGLEKGKPWKRVEKAYDRGYRAKKPREKWAGDGWRFHAANDQGAPVPIHFLGVWDTVGALGIPNDLAILNLLDNTKKYAFHDTRLNDDIHHARHAVALDERRAAFAPTLWQGVEHRSDSVRQIWFPGVHSDVGGGYLEKGLSDGALDWMMTEAAGQGLGLLPDMVEQVTPDSRDVLHNSQRGFFKHLRTHPRSIPDMTPASHNEDLHESAVSRQQSPPITQAHYHSPSRTLQPGDPPVPLSIYAAEHWNETGLFLEAGAEYEFKAEGEWLDRTIQCGPEGTSDGRFEVAEIVHLAGTFLGFLERTFKKLTDNEEADFKGTKRVEKAPWFALIGVIANGGSPNAKGEATPGEQIIIKKGCRHTVEDSGYLHCFANDAWNFYGNNRGSVNLSVRRLS